MRILLFMLIFINVFVLRASHIVGGDIYYDYLGNNNYTFYISMYRDCNSPGAAFDSPLNLAVYNASNVLIQSIQVPYNGSAQLPVIVANPCVTSTPNNCTEGTLYSTTINLPPSPGGYNVTYQRCCRGPNITNVVNPGDVGFTLTCHVPEMANNLFINSSPRFINYPPLVLCSGDDLLFDHSANDPDGDQLVYSLITPFQGATALNPMPIPAPPPPYFSIPWAAGFGATTPLGPGASITIDPNSGALTVIPNLIGKFVVGVQVQEIRNGIVINQTVRDFLFEVFDCAITLQAILPPQDQLPGFVDYCQGLSVDFENNTVFNNPPPGTNYLWDFGVPGISTDTSTLFEPSYTYPASGIYQVMMIVNPGWQCTDTAFMEVNVNLEMDVSFTSNDSLCFLGNSFDFISTFTGPPGSNFNWDFGPNANPTSANTQNVNNVTFNSSGYIQIALDIDFSVCDASFTDSIYIFPDPIAEIVLPAEVECSGLSVDFGNNSQNAILYNWDFGVPGIITDVSTDETPSYIYPSAGTYTITLIAGSSSLCQDTITATITVSEELFVSFVSEDSLCFTDNSFNFDGTVSGPPNTVYTWNFGPDASIQTSNNVDEPNVSFNVEGPIPITLTGTFGNCTESVTQYIYLFAEPFIDFTLAPGQQCVPFEAHFIDLSIAETEISYTWDFGDGGTSSDQNPIHLYVDTGVFMVTLNIETVNGCVGGLSLSNSDLVDVQPIPHADFTLSPDYTDICHSVVHFTDLSSGGTSYFYWFDDSTSFSNEQNASHLYFNEGWHRPMLIVENEMGCRDTAYNKLYIEPFTFYAPNAFTPDGDEFNNTFLPIVYLQVEDWKMEIVNRWGQVVFESNDLNFGWDGTNQIGRYAQEGTYVWKVSFHSCEPLRPARVITGHITLIK